jgi:hypothetical protein
VRTEAAYHVICGCFKEPWRADRLVARLKKEGRSPLILRLTNGFLCVSVQSFPTEHAAWRALERFRRTDYCPNDAWVYSPENGERLTEKGRTEKGGTEKGTTEKGTTEQPAGVPEGRDVHNPEQVERSDTQPGVGTEQPAGVPQLEEEERENEVLPTATATATATAIRPLFTIKTNLLYDLALTPHLGVEVPLGERFSIGAEFMRGWWLRRDWSFCWQLQAAALEGRYWFSPRMERHRSGGWFAGVFVQAGFYDFQFERTAGVQGEFVMAGLSGGYLCPLDDAWSLEFSLGLGYLVTDYRRYTVAPTHDGHELVATMPQTRLTGAPYPLKIGVSLQYTINRKRKLVIND